MRSINAAYYYKCIVICLSLGRSVVLPLLDISVSTAKTDKRIDVQFGLWTRGAQETEY